MRGEACVRGGGGKSEELERVCACVRVCVRARVRVCACVRACACARACAYNALFSEVHVDTGMEYDSPAAAAHPLG